MTRSRSDRWRRRAAILALALVAGLLLVGPVLAAVVTTNLFIVREGETLSEDQYVASSNAIVEGTIDGDLVVFSGNLTIVGEVTGDVTGAISGRVVIGDGARVGGSLRVAAREARVDGEVGDDVASVAVSTAVGPSGRVGRDVIAIGWSAGIEGEVGRDVRGRTLRTTISGVVAGDVDMAVQWLTVTSTAEIGGDIFYRSSQDAAIAPDAMVAGEIVKLPSQSNFVYGVMLTVANFVSFLGFLVVGIAVLWLFRRTSVEALAIISDQWWGSLILGVVVAITVPLVALLLAVTLVGIPFAVVIGLGMLLMLAVGPVPIVTKAGSLILRGRGEPYGPFLVGAVLLRLVLWVIPLIGAPLFLLTVAWGTGAWAWAAWRVREAT